MGVMLEASMGEQQTWVVAVSGGIDSVVLLDILHQHSQARLVVAHVDHGIRDDGDEDLLVVQKHAAARNIHLEYTKLELSPSVSEEKARTARYEWLHEIADKHKAVRIVTAHHQDDVLETIIINQLRGTGWRGLASLRSTEMLYRPLLHMSKARIIAYALHHKLEWRDDNTNDDMRYLRNVVRSVYIPRLSAEQRHELISLYEKQIELRSKIDEEIKRHVGSLENDISRYWLTMVPSGVATECLQMIVGTRLQRQHQQQLLHFVRTAKVGSTLELPDGLKTRVTAGELIVSHP